jgi:hypothetical protein
MNDFENFSREGMDYKWIYVYEFLFVEYTFLQHERLISRAMLSAIVCLYFLLVVARHHALDV